MSETDRLIANNTAYAEGFDKDGLAAAPASGVAIVACMDARLDPAKALGLAEGDAHVIRNAGGVVTEDVLRSLVISQRLLGTREVVLLHHTQCGMETFTGEELAGRLESEVGRRPEFAFETFASAEEDVRESAARITADPFLPHPNVRGFLYEVETGRVREVPLA